MSDCFVLYLLLTCMKKKTSGADKFTNNTMYDRVLQFPTDTDHAQSSRKTRIQE